MTLKRGWVLSNRLDDKVVLWERDDAHPGGEAFIASSAPAYVAYTPEVQGLLDRGYIVEVPEPAPGPKRPLVPDENPGDERFSRPTRQDMPGQRTRYGRKPDQELFPGETVKRKNTVGVPKGVIVPVKAEERMVGTPPPLEGEVAIAQSGQPMTKGG